MENQCEFRLLLCRWLPLTILLQAGIDGLTFDYESPIKWNDPSVKTYVKLVNETRQALRLAVLNSQVSVCVAWSPDDIDGKKHSFFSPLSSSFPLPLRL
jgi:hypothetical protein